MNKTVIHAALHNKVNHIPGIGDIGHTFPSQNKTLEGLEMSISNLGLLLKYTYRGLEHTTLFPLAAVAIVSLANE